MTTDVADCPFCNEIRGGDVFASNELAVVLDDACPAVPGHRLVLPRQHYETLASIPGDAVAAMWQLIVCLGDVQITGPDTGLNIGMNVGSVAGQTVDHVHVHVIPRFAGDVLDPRGGVRGVIPGRQVPERLVGGPTPPRSTGVGAHGAAGKRSRYRFQG